MKNYYMLSNGRIKRDQNTLVIEQQSTGVKRPIPVEDVESLFVFGEVDVNSKVLNFLAQKHIPLHLFNYYGSYSGTFHPREYLHSGYLVVQQVSHYSDPVWRMIIARETVQASAHSIGRTLAYYARRKPGSRSPDDTQEPTGEIVPLDQNRLMESQEEQESIVDLALKSVSIDSPENELEDEPISNDVLGQDPTLDIAVDDSHSLVGILGAVERLARLIPEASEIDMLRGIEGKMRERYYDAWRHILIGDWSLERRVRRPPDNELNALISFGNSWLYSICVSEIYRTQLTPTIAYLHEPGERRFSLALDLSELFKPLIVDRVIFRLINNRQIEPSHFDKTMDGCMLTDSGKQLYLKELEAKLVTTIRHRRLKRHVSYRHLIRLECYKLVRHLTGVENYHAFRTWW